MGTEHLDFITFCVGSLADALRKSVSQVYMPCARRGCWTTISCLAMMPCTPSVRTIL